MLPTIFLERSRRPLAFLLLATLVLAGARHGHAGIANPTEISDLVVWLDADSGVTESGGAVTDWANQVGSAVFAQGDTTRQPVLSSDPVSGHPTLYFSDDYLNLPTGSADHIQLDDTNTAFFVIKPSDLPSGDYPRFFGHYGNGQYRVSDAKAGMWVGQRSELESPLVTTDRFQVLAYRLNDNVQTAINNLPITETAPGAAFSSSDLTVGGVRAEPGGAVGDMAEIVVYDRSLSDAEAVEVGRYLAGKYQLPAPVGNRESLLHESFNYDRATSPANPTAADHYHQGENGPSANWTEPWTGVNGSRINGADQAIQGVGDLPGYNGQLRRAFELSTPDDTTLYFSLRMRDPGQDSINARLRFNGGGATEVGMGFHGGRLRAQLSSSGPIFGPNGYADDGQWHLFVGKLEFDAVGNQERLSVWVDPTDFETAGVSHVVENDIGVSTLSGQFEFYTWGPDGTRVYIDELRVGTTWASVVVPEPGSLGLALFGLIGLLAAGRRRRSARTRG